MKMVSGGDIRDMFFGRGLKERSTSRARTDLHEKKGDDPGFECGAHGWSPEAVAAYEETKKSAKRVVEEV
ncbi:hypothetical protein KJ632_01985 [Patescibacteria group bacterium]|nr:hypothetical protein [Patescibacteria group bacterium]